MEKMWRIFYFLLLLAVIVPDIDSIDSDKVLIKYYFIEDLKNIEGNGPALQHSLFSLISTIRSETSSISESQDAVTNTLLELKERQEQLEMKLLEFMEKTDKYISNSEERQENLEMQFIGKSENSFLNLEKRQENLEAKLLEFMEKTDKYFSSSEKSQLSPTERKTYEFVKRTEHDMMSGKSGNHTLDKNEEWTTIARRQDGSLDFNRNWTEYQNGFGNPDGEFFIGLEKLHNLTTQGAPQELLIILQNVRNETRFAKYDNFKIGNAEEKYELLELGTYSGDAGDPLTYHKNMKFSTFDNDNDNRNWNCARLYKSGWWFDKCYEGNLFGLYGEHWHFFWGSVGRWDDELKFVEMKIRSKL